MNIKFNWGTGILLFILLFLAAMAVFLVFASKQEFNLVEDNYYEKAVNYQQHIDKMNNTASLSSKIQIVQDEKYIKLVFPSDFKDKTLEGTIQFYFAANEKNDLKTTIATDSVLTQIIPSSSLTPGKYTVKIDWKSDNKVFYFEESLIKK